MDERDLTGEVIGGKYRLDRTLGHGGMGAVYAATHLEVGRRVAVKLMLPALARDRTALARFRRETEIAAGLGHPNIVQVTDFGTDALGPFYVMDLLEGEPLSNVLRRDGPLEPRRATSIAIQILSALAAVHAREIVHRDLKPPNVFIANVAGLGEIVKILDFGVAKLSGPEHTRLTATGFAVGTVSYMAPEQLTGGTVDARADLYALGVILYRCLAGRLPYEGSRELLPSMILSAPATPLRAFRPDVDPRLAAIVDRALAKDPNARYASARAMTEALGAVDRTAPLPAAALAPGRGAETSRTAQHDPQRPATAATRREREVDDREVPSTPPTRHEPALHGPARHGRQSADTPKPPSPPPSRRARAAPLVLAASAAAALVVLASAIGAIALLLRSRHAEATTPAPDLAHAAGTSAPGAPAPVVPIQIDPRNTLSEPTSADSGKPPLQAELDPQAQTATASERARERVDRLRRRFEDPTLSDDAVAAESDDRFERPETDAPTGDPGNARARRVEIGGVEYIERGDVTYRVVLSNLDLGGMYSAFDDSRALNTLRGDVVDCVIASDYAPSAAMQPCWTVDVAPDGTARSFAPHSGNGDAVLDRCATRAFHAMRLGPTRSGSGGHARICFHVYRRAR